MINKKISKLLCMLSIVILCINFLSSSTIFASEDRYITINEFDILNFYSDEIIGKPNVTSNNVATKDNLLPNYLTLDWAATESGIYLYFRNIGLDSIDVVGGTINTGNLQESFSYSNVPIGENTYYVYIPVKTCSESISIKYYAMDGGDAIGSTISYGSRAISSTLINMWTLGTFNSRSACLEYHFQKHGLEVGMTNIAGYVRLADFVRNTVISQGIAPIRSVGGTTPNVYRYELNGNYLHVQHILGAPTGNLISFGLAYN